MHVSVPEQTVSRPPAGPLDRVCMLGRTGVYEKQRTSPGGVSTQLSTCLTVPGGRLRPAPGQVKKGGCKSPRVPATGAVAPSAAPVNPPRRVSLVIHDLSGGGRLGETLSRDSDPPRIPKA